MEQSSWLSEVFLLEMFAHICLFLGYVFSCAQCRTTHSIRNGTFFQQSHLSLGQPFELMHCWSRQEASIGKLMHELDIGSPNTNVTWKNFCRDICAQYFILKPMRIGGPGHIVEIDRSSFDNENISVIVFSLSKSEPSVALIVKFDSASWFSLIERMRKHYCQQSMSTSFQKQKCNQCRQPAGQV